MLYLALASFGIACVSAVAALFALAVAADAKDASNAATKRVNALTRFFKSSYGGLR